MVFLIHTELISGFISVPHISSELAQRQQYSVLDDEDTICNVFCLRESNEIRNVPSNRDVYFVFVFRFRSTERVIRIGIVPSGGGDNPPLSRMFGAFAKLRKATILVSPSLSVRVCPSIHLSVRKQQLGFHWTNFHKTWYLSIFRKPVEKIKV